MADFTRLPEQVEGTFACVLACDNAVAHLHSDEDLARFAAGVATKLEPGGLAVSACATTRRSSPNARPGIPCASVRARSRSRSGIGTTTGRSYELAQFTLRGEGERWETTCRRTRLRALLREEVCGALAAAGLADVRWRTPEETGYYQPIVTGRLR